MKDRTDSVDKESRNMFVESLSNVQNVTFQLYLARKNGATKPAELEICYYALYKSIES